MHYVGYLVFQVVLGLVVPDPRIKGSKVTNFLWISKYVDHTKM